MKEEYSIFLWTVIGLTVFFVTLMAVAPIPG